VEPTHKKHRKQSKKEDLSGGVPDKEEVRPAKQGVGEICGGCNFAAGKKKNHHHDAGRNLEQKKQDDHPE